MISIALLALIVVGCRESGDAVYQSEAIHRDTAKPEIRLQGLPSSETGITFNNTFADDGSTNVFIWHFIYNGGGVAIGDINNDDLPDLYFCGNRVSDRLYLNKGNFTFEDITQAAGIQGDAWSTGVTMADVNGDGFLDIYVCRNSPTANFDNNRNKLFINNRDLTFSEQGSAYGIDDPGFGIQATFFDADQDGDLDMYLANQPFDAFARLVNQPQLVQSYPQTNRYFVFDQGRYIDKTEEMGMLDSRYSLNVAIGDFDMNGWTDLYVCNDYFHADQLYMNTGGRFVDALRERTQHISFYSMGSDVADINNDGWLDMVILDMAFEDHYRSKTNMGSMDPERFWGLVQSGQHYQYPQNTLQLNAGHGYFTEVAQVSGVHKSDWSFAGIFADIEHDGDQDLLITNGVVRDMQNNDFNAFVKEKYSGQVGPHNLREVMEKLPSNPVANVLYRNDGELHFEKISEQSGFDYKGFSNGLAYGDLDRDGKLDFAVNNLMSESGIYRNVSEHSGNYVRIRIKGPGDNLHGLGITAILYTGNQKQAGTMQTTRGYFSSSEPMLDFGIGKVLQADSLVIIWNSREMSVYLQPEINTTLTIDYEKSKRKPFVLPGSSRILVWAEEDALDHMHYEEPYDDYADQVLLPYKLSQNGPFLSTADVNDDGLEDVFIGGAAGYPAQLYLQQADGSWQNVLPHTFITDKACEDQESEFSDIDGDGDPDLVVVSGSNEFPENSPLLGYRIYMNDGKGGFHKPAGLQKTPGLNAQALELIDIEHDGDYDLFVGGRLIGGKYPVPPASALLVNEDSHYRIHTKQAEVFDGLGLITDAVAADVDGDGDTDLVVVGEWMAPKILTNDGNGNFDVRELDRPGPGIWWTIEGGDFDSDGDEDFLIGNLGWNNKFGGARGTKLEIYADDFDNNGDFDVVLAQQKGDKTLPVRGRECSSQEMPFIWEKFPSFDSYGKAKLDDIIPQELLSESTHSKLRTMSSVVMLNDGDGQFSVIELPLECQKGPIKAFQICDLNRDGHPDFLYAGNHYPTEVETARYDGLFPGYCLGDGKGNFVCKTIFVNNAPLKGDFRDIAMVNNHQGNVVFLFANNAGPLRTITLRHEQGIVQ